MSAENESRIRDVMTELRESLEDDARLTSIDQRLAAGYIANNGDAHHYFEYVDITTMRADLQWLLAQLRRTKTMLDRERDISLMWCRAAHEISEAPR